MNTIPNLDAMSEQDLWAFHKRYKHAAYTDSRTLLGESFPGYTKAARNLAAYAVNKATAMSCRGMGLIEAALVYESICDDIFKRLPPQARW